MLRHMIIAASVGVIALGTRTEPASAASVGCGFYQECIDDCPVSPMEACAEAQPFCFITDGECVIDDFDCGAGWLLECSSEPE